jgi:hypothetical protein
MATSSTKDSAPKFTQQEREAIVDLLHLCIYADAHIGIKEGDYVSKVVAAIGWDTKLSFSAYEPRSIASARATNGNEDALKEYLQRAAARLTSKESRSFAIAKCSNITAADGTHQKEASLVFRIKEALRA